MFVISSSGQVLRVPADEIRRVGRASQGVRTMRVEDGATVVALAPVITQMDEETSRSPEGAGRQGRPAPQAQPAGRGQVDIGIDRAAVTRVPLEVVVGSGRVARLADVADDRRRP